MSNESEMHRAASAPGPKKEVVALSVLHPGERGVVAELLGGRGVLGRMAALGFTPGAEVRIVQNFGHGPLIVLLRDTRVALGRGEAGRVSVVRI
ncbi:MAG: FeoA family protein [Chloroflexota bacterium]|nr:FeoA family protein [Chloroflexota bacterium]